jgi:hypothetical protein
MAGIANSGLKSRPMRSFGRKEWQKNLIALGIVAAAFVAIAFTLFYPSLLIGVHGDALGQSLSKQVGRDAGSCVQRAGGSWRCTAFDVGSYGDRRPGQAPAVYFEVEPHGMLGCWRATRISPRAPPHKVSGCIDIFDVLGTSRRNSNRYGSEDD